MTIPHYINEDQSDIRAIKPGWYGLESNGKLSSGPFPNQENASPESLSRGAILEHRPGGTRPTILKLSPTMRATRKRPWTTWLTRKLLWTLGTRRRREVGPWPRTTSITSNLTRVSGRFYAIREHPRSFLVTTTS